MVVDARTAGERILVVEDDQAAGEYLCFVLDEAGYRTRSAPEGAQALKALEDEPADLVLTDLIMPVMSGTELLARVGARWPELPVVVITGAADIPRVVEAIQLGAVNYLTKPIQPSVLSSAVAQALRARRTPTVHEGGIPELVGETAPMIEVRQQVALAARADVHVLITGETGTGKELVARAIHKYSSRASGPFVAHNCALAPRELVESEFFGHRRGAFTGADRDHVGLFARADGGVLFLDELETLDPMHQAKLLRVLDDGEVRAVGDETTRAVSVRALAATNRDPQPMIAEQTLREDLYYRLRGFEITLPSLRERRDDVPLLARHFLAQDGNEPDPGFTPAALDALCAAPWPGNVRELRNTVRAARAAAGEAAISPQHLPKAVRPGPSPAPCSHDGDEALSLLEAERRAILKALEAAGGNRTRAAQILGIDRSTLRRKLRALSLSTD